jgi:toxin HigB-1
MNVRFNNEYLESLFLGEDVPGKPQFGNVTIKKFRKTIVLLHHIENVSKLRQYEGLGFEKLLGDYKNYCSVRVDQKYRLILKVEGDDFLLAEELVVEDLTNHYK